MDIPVGTKVRPTCNVILNELEYKTYSHFNEHSTLTFIRDEEVYVIVTTDDHNIKYQVPKSLFNKVFEIVCYPLPKIELNLSIICVESKDNTDQYKICINGAVVDIFSINHNNNRVGLRMFYWVEQVLGIEWLYDDYLRVIDTYLERNE